MSKKNNKGRRVAKSKKIRHVLTKEQMAHAIKTEPELEPGAWFDDGKKSGQCSVCAVGAVLREHMMNRQITSVAHALIGGANYEEWRPWERGSAQDIADNPMAALSALFEDTADLEGVKKARKKCIAFINSDCFPEKITIEVQTGKSHTARYREVISPRAEAEKE